MPVALWERISTRKRTDDENSLCVPAILAATIKRLGNRNSTSTCKKVQKTKIEKRERKIKPYKFFFIYFPAAAIFSPTIFHFR